MKINKSKVLLYLKKSSLDKQGKAPIMGRITLNNSMAQFSCKLSCNPKLWNSRSSRLEGKSGEATETNAKIERILLSVNAAFDNLVKRNGLKYKRKKTGVQAMVKLLPEAIELISKYENAGQSTLMPHQNYFF